jgi:hypothetical protein
MATPSIQLLWSDPSASFDNKNFSSKPATRAMIAATERIRTGMSSKVSMKRENQETGSGSGFLFSPKLTH